MSVKEKEVTKTTFADYKQRVSQFKKYLERIKIIDYPITELNKKIVSEFLNTYDGAKNRNNVKVVLSSLFNILSNESYIEFNYIKEIRNLKVEDKPVKIYIEKDINHITELLKENDYDLLMFIRFVSYMFWRPVEILIVRCQNK